MVFKRIQHQNSRSIQSCNPLYLSKDYEEIFIAVHGLLGIYKNIIIFIATIEFINTNRKNIVIIMAFLIVIYYLVFKVIRNVEKKVVKNYYDYKYSYVRVLE
jgi:hypothetical protein